MAVELNSLLDELSGMTKGVEEPPKEPETPPTGEGEGDDDKTPPAPPSNHNITNGAEPPKDDKEEGEEEKDFLSVYKEELGYTGDITGDEGQTLIDIAKAVIAAKEEELTPLRDPNIKKVVDFLQAGGDLVEYVSKPQKSDYFEKFSIKEDDTANLEAFISWSFEQNGIKENRIKAIIKDAKESNELFDLYKERLEVHQTAEKESNTEIEKNEIEREKKEKEDRDNFFEGLKQGFTSLTGVTVDKEVSDEAAKLSMPNSKGLVEIGNLIGKLEPKDHAVINTLITALSKGKSFTYNPTKTKATDPRKTNISTILVKKGGNTASSGVSPISELESLLKPN